MPEPNATEGLLSLVVSLGAGLFAMLSGAHSVGTKRQLRGVVGDGEPLAPRLEALEGRMKRQERRQSELESETRDELRALNASLSDMREVLGRIDERTKSL